MIRIQEHIRKPNPELFLTKLAELHWDNLNCRFKKNKELKPNSLIKKCEKYLLLTDNSDYKLKYAFNDVLVAKRHKLFFKYLLKNKCKKLKEIVISKPLAFDNLRVEILNILNESDIYTGTVGNYSQTKFGKLLSEIIFAYKTFRASDYCKQLFIDLNFKSATCPYCNYNKIDIINLKSTSTILTKKKAYMDLDHFYPKSLNPFFALSFFNLIPSCHSCNSSDKGDKPFSISTQINPYYEAFDDIYKFRISLISILGDPIDSILIEKGTGKPLDNSVNDFNLEAKYQNNFESAKNLIDLFWKYKSKIGTPFESDFIELILKDIPKERNKILDFPKGKLNRDILKQLDVNKVLGIS